MQKEVVGQETEKDTDGDMSDGFSWSTADQVEPLNV
jgi:hypothetical protein